MIKKSLTKHEFIEKQFCSYLEWDPNPPDLWTQRDWDRSLITKVNMISHTIQLNTHQGGADTIRLGSDLWFLGLDEYELYDRHGINDTMVGSLCGRYEVFLDENVPYNEIWVSRERPTFGITLEDIEGEMSTIIFNHREMFNKKKLKGRIKING